jgi:hypothetical protein
MDNEHYSYLCCLIIHCSAYRIGGPAIHERIIEQNLPELQRHYPDQTWTHGRVRRLFEGGGLLTAIAFNRVNISAEQDQVIGARTGHGSSHAEQIHALLIRIDSICKKLQAEVRRRG